MKILTITFQWHRMYVRKKKYIYFYFIINLLFSQVALATPSFASASVRVLTGSRHWAASWKPPTGTRRPVWKFVDAFVTLQTMGVIALCSSATWLTCVLCVLVSEGTGSLLRLRVLPSGAGQVLEERIFPEGQWLVTLLTDSQKHISSRLLSSGLCIWPFELLNRTCKTYSHKIDVIHLFCKKKSYLNEEPDTVGFYRHLGVILIFTVSWCFIL